MSDIHIPGHRRSTLEPWKGTYLKCHPYVGQVTDSIMTAMASSGGGEADVAKPIKVGHHESLATTSKLDTAMQSNGHGGRAKPCRSYSQAQEHETEEADMVHAFRNTRTKRWYGSLATQ